MNAVAVLFGNIYSRLTEFNKDISIFSEEISKWHKSAERVMFPKETSVRLACYENCSVARPIDIPAYICVYIYYT